MFCTVSDLLTTIMIIRMKRNSESMISEDDTIRLRPSMRQSEVISDSVIEADWKAKQWPKSEGSNCGGGGWIGLVHFSR